MFPVLSRCWTTVAQLWYIRCENSVTGVPPPCSGGALATGHCEGDQPTTLAWHADTASYHIALLSDTAVAVALWEHGKL